MKIYFKLFLIVLTFSFLAVDTQAKDILQPNNYDKYYPTQADMLNYSENNLDKIDKKYNQICDKLIQNFKSDKYFTDTLKQNQQEFFKYRLTQRDVILPSFKNDSRFYGSNYKLYSDAFLIKATNVKINDMKKMIELYCLYNDFLHSETACSYKTINRIFK